MNRTGGKILKGDYKNASLLLGHSGRCIGGGALLASGGAASTIFGYEFTLTNPLNVAALGIWDQGNHTLVESHQVGLWTNSGALLASTTVDSASLPAASANPDGQWLFTNISPITLPAGTYRLGAFYPSLADTFLAFGVSITTAAGVTFGGEALTISGSFGFPDRVFPANVAVFGPNISTVALASPVPEPSSLITFATGLAVLLAISGWVRRKT